MKNNDILNYLISKVRECQLDVNSILITEDNKTVWHDFKLDVPVSIRSISKVISCLGIAKAIDFGVFDLETPVMQFFDHVKITNKSNLPALQRLKLKHLLTLTMGHDVGLMFSKDMRQLPEDTDWVSYVLNYDMPYMPGEHFVYNNADTYLISAIIQKQTKMNLSQWVQEYIFKELGISNYIWDNSAQGICLGASGLNMINQDLHKIAILMLKNGMTESGKQLVDASWIKAMTTPQVKTADLTEYKEKQSRSLNKMAYGYHIWICGDGSKEYPKDFYFCDGTDGQFLIVLPKKNIAITVLSMQKNMNPFYPIFDILI